ncbi:MAG: ORF6N domain-containing protein [Treponema sp.]|nr:ORF6N domain-containing protein [Treponema sp.]
MANQLTQIKKMIYDIRGQKVMLDSDLATLYGVELRSLNQAVKRNIERFPSDFMFQLTGEEWENRLRRFGNVFVSGYCVPFAKQSKITICDL